MNKNIEALYQIAQKETKRIIGLMSGTSLDGLDIALCEISGSGVNTNVKLAQFETISYSEEIKTEIRKVIFIMSFQNLCYILPIWRKLFIKN